MAITLDGTTGITASGSLSDSIGNVRDVPVNNQTGAYVLVATDDGKTYEWDEATQSWIPVEP